MLNIYLEDIIEIPVDVCGIFGAWRERSDGREGRELVLVEGALCHLEVTSSSAQCSALKSVSTADPKYHRVNPKGESEPNYNPVLN